MKKLLFITVLCLFSFVEISLAEVLKTDTTKVDTVALQAYVGKYKMKNAPFENVNVSIVAGKLVGEAEGQGTAELAMTNEKDSFEIVGFGGIVVFLRSDDNKIKGCSMSIQGNTLEGDKVP